MTKSQATGPKAPWAKRLPRHMLTRRKDGAKAPSLLDHSELRFPTFDAKAMDLQRRSQMPKPWVFEI